MAQSKKEKPHECRCPQAVNEKLKEINDWLKTNKLPLNITKTKYMLFHSVQKQIGSLHIKIDNINIDRVKQFNFLGLTINENFFAHQSKNYNLQLINIITHKFWYTCLGLQM